MKSTKHTLGLIDGDGYYTNTALLLSDQCGHIIRCAVYEGTGKTQVQDAQGVLRFHFEAGG